jgi:hypothetical protein
MLGDFISILNCFVTIGMFKYYLKTKNLVLFSLIFPFNLYLIYLYLVTLI